jgi:hypothetical protein
MITYSSPVVEIKHETIVEPCEPEKVLPWHSITIDRYVYNLIENVEDKTKYIETLILKDLFSK